MRSKRPIVVAGLLAGLALVFLPLSALADPGKEVPRSVPLPPDVSEESVHNQEIIDEALAPLEEYLERYPSMPSGYADHSGDAATLQAVVKWKGNPPPAVLALEGTTSSGVKISVLRVNYSLNEIEAAARAIYKEAQDEEIPLPNHIGASDAFDGLDVAYSQTRLARLNPADLSKRLESVTDIPVRVVPGVELHNVNRQNDFSPWSGGSAYKNDYTGYCSTGFSVLTPTGEERTLSAGHCDPTGNRSATDRAGDPLTLGGSHAWVFGDMDSLIFDPIGEGAASVHGGPWNAGTSHARFLINVGSDYSNRNGDLVCTSGANSDEHCGTLGRVRVITHARWFECTQPELMQRSGASLVPRACSTPTSVARLVGVKRIPRAGRVLGGTGPQFYGADSPKLSRCLVT